MKSRRNKSLERIEHIEKLLKIQKEFDLQHQTVIIDMKEYRADFALKKLKDLKNKKIIN